MPVSEKGWRCAHFLFWGTSAHTSHQTGNSGPPKHLATFHPGQQGCLSRFNKAGPGRKEGWGTLGFSKNIFRESFCGGLPSNPLTPVATIPTTWLCTECPYPSPSWPSHLLSHSSNQLASIGSPACGRLLWYQRHASPAPVLTLVLTLQGSCSRAHDPVLTLQCSHPSAHDTVLMLQCSLFSAHAPVLTLQLTLQCSCSIACSTTDAPVQEKDKSQGQE